MVSCWFLKIKGVQFPVRITEHIAAGLKQLMEADVVSHVFRSSVVCHVVYGLVMSTKTMDMARLLEPLTMNLFIRMHHGISNSITQNRNEKSDLLGNFRKIVCSRFLPFQFRQSLNNIRLRLRF